MSIPNVNCVDPKEKSVVLSGPGVWVDNVKMFLISVVKQKGSNVVREKFCFRGRFRIDRSSLSQGFMFLLNGVPEIAFIFLLASERRKYLIIPVPGVNRGAVVKASWCVFFAGAVLCLCAFHLF